MNRILIIASTLALLATTALAQDRTSAVLRVGIQDGRVSVTDEQSGLSPRALEALRVDLQSEIARSLLREHGALQIALRGEPLTALRTRLERTNLDDPAAVRSTVQQFQDEHFSQRTGQSLTEPVEVIIGRSFQLDANSRSRSIVAIGAHGRIDAPLADVIAIGSQLALGPAAEVTQRLVSVGSQIDRDPGARIAGQELSLSLPPFETWSHDAAQWTAPERRPAPLGARIAWMLTGLVASFALGSLWLRATPKFHDQVLRELHDRPGMALGIGFAHYFAILPLGLLLVLTVLGIALLPLYGLALALTLWLAYVASATLVGTLLARAWQPWQQRLLGLSLLAAAAWLPVVGALVHVTLVTCGLGAIMRTLYTREPAHPARPAAPSTDPGAAPPPAQIAPQHGSA